MSRTSFGAVALFVVTFVFIFGWKVTPALDLIAITSVMLIVGVFMLGGAGLPRPALTMSLLLVLGVAYACFASILGGGGDPQLALREIRALLNFLGAAALCVLIARVYGREQLPRVVPSILFTALSLHAVLIVVMYFAPALRDSIYSLLSTNDYVNQNAPFVRGLRIPGLTYGLAQTSVLHMFGLLLAPIVYRQIRDSRLMQLLFWVAIFALVLSMFMTGRSGLLLAGVFVPLQHIVRRRAFGRRRLRRSGRLAIPALIGVVVVAVVLFAQDTETWERVRYNISTAGEILEIVTSGGRTGTLLALSEMYFVPTDPAALLVGGLGLGRGDLGHIRSDIGYILLIHSAGLVGLVILLLPLLYGLLVVATARSVDFELRLATALMLSATLILNFKELALMTRNQWSVQCLCLAVIFMLLARGRERASPTHPVVPRTPDASAV